MPRPPPPAAALTMIGYPIAAEGRHRAHDVDRHLVAAADVDGVVEGVGVVPLLVGQDDDHQLPALLDLVVAVLLADAADGAEDVLHPRLVVLDLLDQLEELL